MKPKITILSFLFLSQILYSQIVNIPDPSFKSACVDFPIVDFDGDGIPEDDVDTNNDGEIQVSEAEAVEVFFPRGFGILSMEGIEAFTNLKQMNCAQNSLTTIDLSQNVLLEDLAIYFNVLVELDVSVLPNLKTLDCDFNDLTSLDVSQNPNLERLDFPFNNITSIDISQNPALISFDADSNGLTFLDFSQNPNLEVLSIESNELSTIDFSANPLLRVVDLHDNNFTELDLSDNTNLDKLWCYENDLVSLNIKNGNNMAISILNALDNPELTCVQVDDVVFAETQSNWNIDDAAFYSQNCALGNDTFKISTTSIYPNPTSHIIYIDTPVETEISSVTVYDVLGRRIQEASGTNSLDVSELSSGMFFLTIAFENEKITKQFLKTSR